MFQPDQEPKILSKTEAKALVKEVSEGIITELNNFWTENGLTPQILKVKEFHDTFKCPVGESPNADVPDDVRDLRQRILQEEVDELKEACEKKDIVAVSLSISKLIYNLFGTATVYGIQEKLQGMFNELHNFNMLREKTKIPLNNDEMCPIIENILGLEEETK